MSHHSLVGLPAQARHEVNQGARLHPPAEQEIEELVDEGTIARQRVARQDDAGDLLQQSVLEACAHALEDQGRQTSRQASSQFQRQYPAERNAQDGRALEAVPVEEFAKVVDQVSQAEVTAQGKAIVLTPQLVGDDVKMSSQPAGQRPQQLEAARQARNQYKRGTVAPLAVVRRVVLQMGQAHFPPSGQNSTPFAESQSTDAFIVPHPFRESDAGPSLVGVEQELCQGRGGRGGVLRIP